MYFVQTVNQHINLKFLVKMNKMVAESFQMLSETYGNSCKSYTHVWWHERYTEGQDDSEWSEYSFTSKLKAMLTKLIKLFKYD